MDRTCYICYENKNLIGLNCKHKFCKPCLKRIIEAKKDHPEDTSLIPCPYCRQDVIKTNNKNINRVLKRFNEEQIMKQKYPMMGITTKYYTFYFEKNKNIFYKNRYPKKNKFKVYQNKI